MPLDLFAVLSRRAPTKGFKTDHFHEKDKEGRSSILSSAFRKAIAKAQNRGSKCIHRYFGPKLCIWFFEKLIFVHTPQV